ncbi:MAG: serine/threonine protein kinase, partial [Planctomycetaceae bacterium]|nr:serine/threonine protein kinase [Planctomycetaceae bacterium]
YVMEYLENGSLASFLADGPLPAHEAVRIARSVLQALVHAHSSGILHCDLKPGNVLLDTDFEPRICDFGQSRLTHEQDPALGTLFYMAPEQAATDTIPDARWDVYALGALLYHMLVGHAPFRTPENEQEVRRHETLEQRLAAYRKVLQEGPRPVEHRRVSGVDRRLAEIIDRCLKTDPARRFRNAQEVLNALEFRERARARRPLIALGIVGPVLLLAAMLPIARRAMQSAVDTARANLTERALESDLLSANLLARNLERELIERRAELVEVAADPALREAIAQSEVSNWNDRDSLFRIMGRHHRLLSQAGRRAEEGPIDTSWFLTDVAGYQRWREPLSQETLDRNWAHRDYFHGRNTQYQRGQLPDDLQPISRPHISIAFLSQATHLYMVAISVPVWDDPSSPNRKVIGVLARTAHLGLLLDEYRENRTANRLREISLVDQRSGIVLDHPWMTEQQMARFNRRDLPRVFSRLKVQEIHAGQAAGGNPSGSPEQVRSSDPVPGRVPGASRPAEPAVGVDRTDSYQDPVGRLAEELLASEEGTIPGSRQLWQGVRDRFAHRWLAAFAPVGNTGWTAVVQEREDRAMLPVQQMRADLEKYGQAAIVAGFSLVGLLWYFVVRALNDRAVRVSLLRGRGRSAGTASVGSESS